MAYLFVVTMCALALLFVVSKVAGDIVTWLIQKIMDLKDEVIANRTNGGGTA